MPLMRIDRCIATTARSGRWRWRICARYGHKLNLTSGKSGLILDVVMETGNPADSERSCLCWIATSHSTASRRVRPRPTAAWPAAEQAKARGVADVAFHKKRGLEIEE